jgi:nucleotide-binding universal stress UspA family protein/nitrite reductase/ring-hydroxylating ferredoxin subunit
MSYKRIIIATDGSPTAETAEQMAVLLAKATKGKLTIVHGYGNPEKADAAVARAIASADEQGVKHEVVLSDDDPADAVVNTATEGNADLIVSGSKGLLKGEQLIGSLVRRVLTHAPCDVLLTRARDASLRPQDGSPYRKVLIATDGSATADRAARKAAALAKRLEATVTLVFVGHPKTGELVLQDTAATTFEEYEVDTMILEGEPAEVINATAEKEGFDLVVVGNRGLAGAKAAILGSVPRDIAEYAPCDVLVARTIAQNLDEILPGEGGIVTTGDQKVAVYRTPKGEVVTISAKCTHMGCTVKWNAAEKAWDCPCHGSRYAPTGEVINGPAEKALAPTEL